MATPKPTTGEKVLAAMTAEVEQLNREGVRCQVNWYGFSDADKLRVVDAMLRAAADKPAPKRAGKS